MAPMLPRVAVFATALIFASLAYQLLEAGLTNLWEEVLTNSREVELTNSREAELTRIREAMLRMLFVLTEEVEKLKEKTLALTHSAIHLHMSAQHVEDAPLSHVNTGSFEIGPLPPTTHTPINTGVFMAEIEAGPKLKFTANSDHITGGNPPRLKDLKPYFCACAGPIFSCCRMSANQG
jgi:hypothetical protein